MKKAPSKVPKTGVKTGAKKTFLVTSLMLIWVFCSVVVSQFIVGYLLIWIFGQEILSQPVWSGVYSILSYLLALILIIFVPPIANTKWHITHAVRSDDETNKDKKSSRWVSREQLGLSGTPTWTDIGLSPVAYVVSMLGAAVLMLVFGLFPWFNAEQAQETGFTPYMAAPEKVVAFVVLVVLAPIVEEVIFRGWLYGKLRTRVNMPVAIILTSLLFSIMHFQWNVGVTVFALSVVLCVLREITGTIYAGMLTHMIKNGVAFYLLYVIGM